MPIALAQVLRFNPLPSGTIPGAPVVTAVTASDGQLSVAFTPPASDGGAAITGYQFCVDNGGVQTSWANVASGAGSGDGLLASADLGDTTGASIIVVIVPSYRSGYDVPYDTFGNGYRIAGTLHGAESHAEAAVYYCENPTVGAGHTVFVNDVAGGKYPSIVALADVGSSAVPFDADGGATADGVTSLGTGTVVTTEDNELVVAGLSIQAAITALSLSGFTVLASAAPNANPAMGGSVARKVQTLAGSAGSTWMWTTGVNSSSASASFKGYRGWIAPGTPVTSSPLVISGADVTNDYEFDVCIRAVNAHGPGPASNVVAATPNVVGQGDPGGLSSVFESDDAKPPITLDDGSGSNPVTGGSTDGNAQGGTTPTSKLVFVDIADLSGVHVPQLSGRGKMLRYNYQSGTHGGDAGPGTDSAAITYGKNVTGVGANGGPAGDEYSEWYQYEEVCFFGNGDSFEHPGAGFKHGYWGVTNNNQNGSGPGAVQTYALLVPLGQNILGTTPASARAFRWRNNMQNGSNDNWDQNTNTWKLIRVGRWHTIEHYMKIGTAGNADGIWRTWIDGVLTHNYSTVRFINAAYASSGGDGLAGIWAWNHDPIWGGTDSSVKSRDDYSYVAKTIIQGTLLRSRL